jgi:DNA-binding transcriptional ArsR family regulator
VRSCSGPTGDGRSGRFRRARAVSGDDPAELDGVFVALADPTRRGVIRRLGRGPTSVGDLAREFPMTLPSFMKHVRTLETNGLIRTVKSGRVRTCVLNRERLALLDDWLAEQRRVWDERTDRLERFVTDDRQERHR